MLTRGQNRRLGWDASRVVCALWAARKHVTLEQRWVEKKTTIISCLPDGALTRGDKTEAVGNCLRTSFLPRWEPYTGGT